MKFMKNCIFIWELRRVSISFAYNREKKIGYLDHVTKMHMLR